MPWLYPFARDHGITRFKVGASAPAPGPGRQRGAVTGLGEQRQGPTNRLTDVAGLRVGHAWRQGGGWLTGTTVIVTPGGGAVAGVDVRGGGPGTRETDLLDPLSSADRLRVHAIVLGGGSAFGLAAADGVMAALAEAGRGAAAGPPGSVVPIVPAAILFDLGRGGNHTCRPGPEFGRAAYDAAMTGPRPGPGGLITVGGDALGVVGAGTGAVAGGLKGGVGMASAVLEAGGIVAALAVVNALGSVLHPVTGTLYGAPFGLPGEFDWLTPPMPAALAAGEQFRRPPSWLPARQFNTTIGLIATDVPLTTAQCTKLAGIGHDGLARAVRPAHSMFDGDTIFAISTGSGVGNDSPASPALFHQVLASAADCFTRAVVHGVLSATSVTTTSGHWPAYLDVFRSETRP